MKKKSTGLGLLIPNRIRIGGVTFYKRQGQVVARESETHEKRSNTLPQFQQRQRMRHTQALWKMLRFCEVMFTQRGNAYQNFASIANRLSVVYVPRTLDQASFLMSGIPVSDGTLPLVQQALGEVDGMPALMTDLQYPEWPHHEQLWLYTAVQTMEGPLPRVRFSKRTVSWAEMTVSNERLVLKGEAFADPMQGWALVRIVGDRCSPQTITTRCTLFEQYTTEEALEVAAESYGGLTKEPFL